MFSFDSGASREVLIMKHHKEKFEFVERGTERVMQNALTTSKQGCLNYNFK